MVSSISCFFGRSGIHSSILESDIHFPLVQWGFQHFDFHGSDKSFIKCFYQL